MEKRKRRSFSRQYKAEVVELIRKSGKGIGASLQPGMATGPKGDVLTGDYQVTSPAGQTNPQPF
jgi:hypothetical protein